MLRVFRRLVRVPASRPRARGFPAARSVSSLVGSIEDNLRETASPSPGSVAMLRELRDFSGEPPLANPAGDSGLRVIPLSGSAFPGGLKHAIGRADPGGIFVRQCYDDLYDTMVLEASSGLNALLLGNPGIGKSCAQAYLMWRLVQDAVAADAGSAAGAAGTQQQEAQQRPPFFYRQVGSGLATVFLYGDLAELRAYEQDQDAARVFRAIAKLTKADEAKTGTPLRPRPWAFFEPGGAKAEPPWSDNDGDPTFMVLSASPDDIRYKEFLKNGAVRFFMPPWELDELLDAALWTRSQPAWQQVPKDVADLWHPDKIEESYEIFGGIIRYVLPTAVKVSADAKVARNVVLQEVAENYDVAMRSAKDVGPRKFQSHHFLQLDPVREGPANTIVWGQYCVKMLPSVADEVRVRAHRASLHQIVDSLMQARNDGYNPSIPRAFEQYVMLALTNKDKELSDRILATWMVSRADGSGFDHLKPTTSRTEHPTKVSKAGRVCLRSKEHSFPAVDVEWARDSKTLCAVNATVSTNVRRHCCSAVLTFLESFVAKEFRQDEDTSIELCFFVLASQAPAYIKRARKLAFADTDSEADRLVKCASWFTSSSKADLAQNEDFARYVKVFKARLADWRAGTGALEILQEDARDADPESKKASSDDSEVKDLKKLAAVTSLVSLGILELQVWHSPEDLTLPDQG